MTASATDPLGQVCFLREQAIKARRLAHSLNDERVAAELMRYAEELERRVLELETEGAPSREAWSGLEY
jgi:hypothetical protein